MKLSPQAKISRHENGANDEGNSSVGSPCERWPMATKIAVLTWERRGFSPHYFPGFYRYAWPTEFKELCNELEIETDTKMVI